mmetsp:Transcript_16641/g.25045  ORF Transcript_16641/g.25045 Transcript_16641/m.25045 type:complete len:380 (-) Transcript_16641:22-1161(-)
MKGSINLIVFVAVALVVTVLWIAVTTEVNNDTDQSTDKAMMLESARNHRHIVPIDEVDSTSEQQSISLSPQPKSDFAYVTLIHGIDDTFRYRGYLYNVMIMKTALASYGSVADFIVLIGYTQDTNTEIFRTDLDRLTDIGVRIVHLPRLVDTEKVHFGEMALLKVTPWSFTQYKKIQFFDGDIMPTANMDCFFQLEQNTFNVGNASPLNSGWFLAIPNMQDFEALRAKAVKRLSQSWDEDLGWGEKTPSWLTNARGKVFTQWTFNGASLDQGLLTHYFVINNGRVVLLNGKQALRFQGIGKSGVPAENILRCCKGKPPASMFAHFTGKTKPWLSDIRKASGRNVVLWGKFLDQLNLPVNTSNIHELALKPPLGYFHPNK